LTRGEFETSADYEARIAAASEGLAASGPVVLEWPISGGFSYDADAGLVSYSISSLSLECRISSSSLPRHVTGVTFGVRGRYSEKAHCLSQSMEPVPTGAPYRARNAFGAQVLVTPMASRSVTLFFGFGEYGQEIWEGQPEYSILRPSNLFSVSASPDHARSLRDNAVALLVFTPTRPFHFYESFQITPTFSRPVSGRSVTDNLIGDLRCVALADRELRRVYQMRYVAQRTTYSSQTTD